MVAGCRELATGAGSDLQSKTLATLRLLKQRRRLAIQVQRYVFVLLQYRRGPQRRHLKLDRCSHRFSLSRIRNDAQNISALQYLPDRHRNRLRRNFTNTSKPTLTALLPAARFIEINHEVRFVDVKIGGRIVEGQVPVFTDTDKRNVDRLLRDQLTNTPALHSHILSLAIQKVKSSRLNTTHNPFFQVTPEARRMRPRQPNVLIEMKEHDPAPINLFVRQRVEELELRSTRSRDYVSGVTFVDRLLDDDGSVARRRLAQFHLRFENL